MLDHGAVVGFLLERGFLQARWVVDGTLVVRDVSKRNRNFALDGGSSSPSYFLKQGLDPESAATVLHESAVYTLFSAPGCAMARYIPHFYGYDEELGILILELSPGACDLLVYHLRSRRFSITLARGIGDALGILHSETPRQVRLIDPGATPWILSIHRPDLGIFREASAASLELIKIVQSTPGFGEQLDQLRLTWRPSALIHQDLKWENFLACRSAGSSKMMLKIIDWEGVCPGDPCWDIGSVLSNYLSFWLQSIPITGRDLPERFPELARYPLHRMQPALRACWLAYTKRLGLDDASSASLLLRAVSFAGAGLVVTAYAAAQMLADLDTNLILHLQLAANILARPSEAAAHLLGFAAEVD